MKKLLYVYLFYDQIYKKPLHKFEKKKRNQHIDVYILKFNQIKYYTK